MLILDLGSHDIILGRKWFTQFDIWLDVRNQKLLWPRTHLTEPTFAKEICTPRENLQITAILPRHQADVEKRDRAFVREDKRRADGRNQKPKALRQKMDDTGQSQPRVTIGQAPKRQVCQEIQSQPRVTIGRTRTYEKDHRRNLQKMNRELRRLDPENKECTTTSTKTPRRTQYPEGLPSIDIAMISTVDFHRNLQKEENVLFNTSLYEINRIIQKKLASQDEETNEQLVKRLLPKEYADY